MSIAVAIKTSRALVLATDSRITLSRGGAKTAYFDSGGKLVRLKAPNSHVAAVYFGETARGATRVLEILEGYTSPVALTTRQIAAELNETLRRGMIEATSAQVYLGGFETHEAQGIPVLMELQIPDSKIPLERLHGNSSGILLGGQTDVARRLISGYDSRARERVDKMIRASGVPAGNIWDAFKGSELAVPIEQMSARSLMDFAAELCLTTIRIQRYTLEPDGCGGRVQAIGYRRGNLALKSFYSVRREPSLIVHKEDS